MRYGFYLILTNLIFQVICDEQSKQFPISRVRRQLAPPLMLVSGYACSLNCTLQHASVWASVMGMKSPPPNPLLDLLTPHKPQGDTLSRICDVMERITDCLRVCPFDNFRQVVTNSLNGLSALCDKTGIGSGLFQPSDTAIRCLNTYAESIKNLCRKESESFLSTTMQLKTFSFKNSPADIVKMIGDVCENAMRQSQCVMPAIMEKCDKQGTNVMDQVLQASLGSFKQLFFANRNFLPSSCSELFGSVLSRGDDGTVRFLGSSTTNAQSAVTHAAMMSGNGTTTSGPFSSTINGMKSNATTDSPNSFAATAAGSGSVRDSVQTFVLLFFVFLVFYFPFY